MIRLQRVGKKKQGSYRLIVSEKTRDTQAGNLENLGVYNPLGKTNMVNFNKDRILYWLSVGAQASATVHNLLVSSGIVPGKKMKKVRVSTKRKAALAAKKTAEKPAAA